jgi:hypothetical protein
MVPGILPPPAGPRGRTVGVGEALHALLTRQIAGRDDMGPVRAIGAGDAAAGGRVAGGRGGRAVLVTRAPDVLAGLRVARRRREILAVAVGDDRRALGGAGKRSVRLAEAGDAGALA